MLSPFVAKLEHGCVLSDADRAKLIEISQTSRTIDARQDVISVGAAPHGVHLVIEGIACRYKMLAGGRRQIMALLLPGDFCDLHVAILGAMDHSIGTLTACTMVEIPRAVIDDLTENYPRITRALWWATLVDEAILREWLVSMGGRPADQQLAHLICEVFVRLQVTGRADNGSFALPLTQEDLADILGLSIVHVNRSLQKLRGDGLVKLRTRRMTVLDPAGLQRLAGFSPDYLHLREVSFDKPLTFARVADPTNVQIPPPPSYQRRAQ